MARVIVITGANGGLGRALARRFARDGEKVVLLGRTLAKVEAVAAEIGENALAVACDVTSPDSVRAAFAEIAKVHPTIDVLINNAALFQPSPIEEAPDSLILGGVLTNLAGPMFCARAAIPLMGPGGLIINVSSESVEMPYACLIVYQSTKAALEKFSVLLQDELADKGIRTCIVRAGQMMGEGMSAEMDPVMGARMFQDSMKRGLNMMARGATQFENATQVFRNLIDLPPDLHVDIVSCHPRAQA